MKQIALKGGIIVAVLGILLSFAPRARALVALPTPKNITVQGTYTYDIPDSRGWMTTRTGNFSLNFNPRTNAGLNSYDFYEQKSTSLGKSFFYLGEGYDGSRNKRPVLCVSGNQMNGIYQLQNHYAPLPDISTGLYSNSCISAYQNVAYAVYDQVHNLYIRIILTNVNYSAAATTERPTVLQPVNGAVIDRNQGELTITWAPQSTAVRYSLRMQCDASNPQNNWKQTIDNIENTFYTYTLYNIPVGYTNCHIFVSSVSATGERGDYPVRDFTFINPYVLTTSPINDGTIDANYGTLILWDVIPGNRTYYGQITCESCKKPWSRTFSSTAKFRNISSLLRQLPTNNERVKITVKAANGIQTSPLYLNITR